MSRDLLACAALSTGLRVKARNDAKGQGRNPATVIPALSRDLLACAVLSTGLRVEARNDARGSGRNPTTVIPALSRDPAKQD
ncbi:hypothetical protein [Hyphococcus sp. DH-69]|uniref:hypothetical protein n=1 Tax=Hyphococcus formosus TaxID=3143534 RepID=UPI00398B3CA7